MKKEGIIWLMCISFILTSAYAQCTINLEEAEPCGHCTLADTSCSDCAYNLFPYDQSEDYPGKYWRVKITEYICHSSNTDYHENTYPDAVGFDPINLDTCLYGDDVEPNCEPLCDVAPYYESTTVECSVICGTCGNDGGSTCCPDSVCAHDPVYQCSLCGPPECTSCGKKEYPAGWDVYTYWGKTVDLPGRDDDEWGYISACKVNCNNCNTNVEGCGASCCGRCMAECRDCTFMDLGYTSALEMIDAQLERLRNEHIYSPTIFHTGYAKDFCGAVIKKDDTTASMWLYLIPQRFPELAIQGVWERPDSGAYVINPGTSANGEATQSRFHALDYTFTENELEDIYGHDEDGNFNDDDWATRIYGSGATQRPKEGEWIYWMELGVNEVDQAEMTGEKACNQGTIYCEGSDGIAYSKPVFEFNIDDNKLICEMYSMGYGSPTQHAFWVEGRDTLPVARTFRVDLTPQLPWELGGGCNHPEAVCPWVKKKNNDEPIVLDITTNIATWCTNSDKFYARFHVNMNYTSMQSPDSQFQTAWMEVPCDVGNKDIDWVRVQIANKDEFVRGGDCNPTVFECMTPAEDGTIGMNPSLSHTDFIPNDAIGFYARMFLVYKNPLPPLDTATKFYPWMYMSLIDDQTSRITGQAIDSDTGWCCGDKTVPGFLGDTAEYNDSLDDPDRDMEACMHCPVGNHKATLLDSFNEAHRKWDEHGEAWIEIEGDVGRCCGDDTQLAYGDDVHTCIKEPTGKCCALPSEGGCLDGFDGPLHDGVVDPDDRGTQVTLDCNKECDRLIAGARTQVEDCGRLTKCLDKDFDGNNYDACAAFCRIENNEKGDTFPWEWLYAKRPDQDSIGGPTTENEGDWGYEKCTNSNWIYGNWMDIDRSSTYDYDLWLRCSGWGEGYFRDGANNKSYVSYDTGLEQSYLCLGRKQGEVFVCGHSAGKDFNSYTTTTQLVPTGTTDGTTDGVTIPPKRGITYDNGGSPDFQEIYYCNDNGQWTRDLDNYWETARNGDRVQKVGDSDVCDDAVGSPAWTGTFCCGEGDDFEETYNDVVGDIVGDKSACWKGAVVPENNNPVDTIGDLSEIRVVDGILHGCAIHEDKALNPAHLDGEYGTSRSAEIDDAMKVLEKKSWCVSAKKEFSSDAEERRCQYGGKALEDCFETTDVTYEDTCTVDTVSTISTLCYKANDKNDFTTYVYCGAGCTDDSRSSGGNAYCKNDPDVMPYQYHVDFQDNYIRDTMKHRKDYKSVEGYKDQGFRNNTWLEYIAHNPNPHNAFMPTDVVIFKNLDTGYNGRIVNVTANDGSIMLDAKDAKCCNGAWSVDPDNKVTICCPDNYTKLTNAACVTSTTDLTAGWEGWNNCGDTPSIVECLNEVCEGFNSIVQTETSKWEYCPGRWRVDNVPSTTMKLCCPCDETNGCPDDVWNSSCHTLASTYAFVDVTAVQMMNRTDVKDEVICTNKHCQGENSVVTKIVYDGDKRVEGGPFCCDGEWYINAFGTLDMDTTPPTMVHEKYCCPPDETLPAGITGWADQNPSCTQELWEESCTVTDNLVGNYGINDHAGYFSKGNMFVTPDNARIQNTDDVTVTGDGVYEDRPDHYYCDIVGPEGNEYMCSYKEKWVKMSGIDPMEKILKDTAGNYNVHLSYVEWPVADNWQRAGCCNISSCWNGIGWNPGAATLEVGTPGTPNTYPKCTHDQTNHANEGPFPETDGITNLRCLKGTWTSATPDRHWDLEVKGYCPREDQCLVSIDTDNSNFAYNDMPDNYYIDGMSPQCITDGQYIEDNYCADGNWTTRTHLLVQTMFQIAAKTAPFNHYRIFCDSYDKALNYFDYQMESTTAMVSSFFADGNAATCTIEGEKVPCANKVCVLTSGPGADPTDVIVGTTLNIDIDDSAVGGESFLYTLGFATNDVCNDAKNTNGNYHACTDAAVSWNEKLKSVIFRPKLLRSPANIPMTTADYWGYFATNIRTWMENLLDMIVNVIKPTEGGAIGAGELEYAWNLDEAHKFDRLYYSKTDGKSIFGIWESNYDEYTGDMQTMMTIEYTGFTGDICASLNLHGGDALCYENAGVQYVIFKIASEPEGTVDAHPLFRVWNDLTAGTRIY